MTPYREIPSRRSTICWSTEMIKRSSGLVKGGLVEAGLFKREKSGVYAYAYLCLPMPTYAYPHL